MIKGIPKEILDRFVVEQPHAYDHPEDYKIVGIKAEPKPCDDCDRTVVNRHTSSRISIRPVKHWRTICDNCKCYHNPKNGKFDIPLRAANSFFREYLNSKTK